IHAAGWTRAARAAAAASARLALARGGRDTKAWITSLREYVHDARGYRVAPLEPDDLFSLAVDASADAEIRAGALVALASKPEHQPRVRVAADDIADPALRRVALASDDDELLYALEKALEKSAAKRPLS